ncbi:aminopeptidase [Treponema sp.]
MDASLTAATQLGILNAMNSHKLHPAKFADAQLSPKAYDVEALKKASRIAIAESLKVKEGERVLIITNPDFDVSCISKALYDACMELGAKPVLIYQSVKTQMDFAEAAVSAAISSEPEVIISMSAEKLGKDALGSATPYMHEGRSWNNLFHLLMYGKKTCRSFWSPSTSLDSFIRTVPIDYAVLSRRCAAIKAVLDSAVQVRVRAPGGTDVLLGLQGREAKLDDGDFALGGRGGNLPAGETFISPENGTAEGIIVFDGSISLHDGDILIKEPVRCTVQSGYVQEITGGAEAAALRETISLAEKNAHAFERDGKIPKDTGSIYARNARNIGELGIGLNPEATISGAMLEDEKAFKTCHFAIGHNYDEDAPFLIHLDALVRKPTIIAILADGTEVMIEDGGELTEAFR